MSRQPARRRWGFVPAALALLALATACTRETAEVEIVKNTCLANLNCQGKDVVCDPTLLQCVRLKTVEPYRVVLRVEADSDDPAMIDAGVTLVEQATFALTLDGAVAGHALEVPAAVHSYGKVQAVINGEMRPLESEITLTPKVDNAAIPPTVVSTTEDSDAGNKQIDVLLNPQLLYDVRVQPLLITSTTLPPLHQEEYDPRRRLEPDYGEIEARSARLTSFDLVNWRGNRIRLESKLTGEAVSSIVAVGADAGVGDAGVGDAGVGDAGADSGAASFTLYAAREVFDAPDTYKLALSLSSFPRWQVKIALDGPSVAWGTNIAMPHVPPTKLFIGQVEHESGEPIPNAEVLFLSDFPVVLDQVDDVGGGDWCRLRSNELSPQLTCSARLSTKSKSKGEFDIDLLPGDYRVIVTPDKNVTTSHDRRTHLQQVKVTEGQIFPLPPATLYAGTVQSPQQQGMPKVTVYARALGQEDSRAPEISRYNRSNDVETDGRGQFSFYLDEGLFNLSIEPPYESGFAWLVCPSIFIRGYEKRTTISLQPLRPSAPVPISGILHHAGIPLRNAHIDAFAQLDTEDGPQLVLVARAVSDAEGAYRLLMPPYVPPIQKGAQPPCPPKYE